MKITIVEYRPEWRKLFDEEKELLGAVLGITAKVEHIGSTSVDGLAAKPIIDIMIGLEDFSIADNIVPKIEALGYDYIQKYEVVMPLRRYFVKNEHEMRTYHIHMVETGSEFWERHLLFRDYLRENPDIANEYAALKKSLAGREWKDGNEYTDAKTEFIRSVECKAKEQATMQARHVNSFKPTDR